MQEPLPRPRVAGGGVTTLRYPSSKRRSIAIWALLCERFPDIFVSSQPRLGSVLMAHLFNVDECSHFTNLLRRERQFGKRRISSRVSFGELIVGGFLQPALWRTATTVSTVFNSATVEVWREPNKVKTLSVGGALKWSVPPQQRFEMTARI